MSLRSAAFAFGKNGRASDNNAAGLVDQFLHSGERFAGADNIIDNDHTLAFDKLGILAVEVQRLHLGRSNGMYFNADGVGHVGFDALACDKMLLFAGLARHFVDKTDGLGFGCDKIVVRRKESC